ncbi:hypothetical protein ACFQE1_04340 [Halobium palmae]|uniref:Uncharacterized protein n=1 Tax=Halobium palmae TaxID=1776492 RepID=A0ABD5RXF5_9EURY
MGDSSSPLDDQTKNRLAQIAAATDRSPAKIKAQAYRSLAKRFSSEEASVDEMVSGVINSLYEENTEGEATASAGGQAPPSGSGSREGSAEAYGSGMEGGSRGFGDDLDPSDPGSYGAGEEYPNYGGN